MIDMSMQEMIEKITQAFFLRIECGPKGARASILDTSVHTTEGKITKFFSVEAGIVEDAVYELFKNLIKHHMRKTVIDEFETRTEHWVYNTATENFYMVGRS